MEVIICKDYQEMSEKAAQFAAVQVQANPTGLVSFPGGDTPLGMVHAFADMVNRREVNISRLHYVSLDEWAGLSDKDEGSCGFFNRQELLARLEQPFGDVHLINGAAADMEAERAALDEYIISHGPLDVSVLGIGMNGHMGFNEAGVSFDLNAHIIDLDKTTREVMGKYFGGRFQPTQGITQGIAQIMAAKMVVLIANGRHKAEIIRQAVRGSVTNDVPASVLQNHPNCFIVVDQEAAFYL